MTRRNDGLTCTATNRQGQRCGNPPIHGGTVCRYHGGKAPQVEASAKQRLLNAADPAAAKLIDLLNSDDEKIQLAAARDLLDRAGLKAPTKVEGEITIEAALAAIDAEIARQDRLYDELTNDG